MVRRTSRPSAPVQRDTSSPAHRIANAARHASTLYRFLDGQHPDPKMTHDEFVRFAKIQLGLVLKALDAYPVLPLAEYEESYRRRNGFGDPAGDPALATLGVVI